MPLNFLIYKTMTLKQIQFQTPSTPKWELEIPKLNGMQPADLLVWLDMETTGLLESNPDVLELALLISNKDASQIYGTLHLPIAHTQETINKADEWVKKNVGDALQQSLSHPCRLSYAQADQILVKWLNMYGCATTGPRSGPTLAGNSVWFDRTLLAKFFPQCYAKLHYRQLDVTSVVYALHAFNPHHSDNMLAFPPKALLHSACSDLIESIAQYRHTCQYSKRIVTQ